VAVPRLRRTVHILVRNRTRYRSVPLEGAPTGELADIPPGLRDLHDVNDKRSGGYHRVHNSGRFVAVLPSTTRTSGGFTGGSSDDQDTGHRSL